MAVVARVMRRRADGNFIRSRVSVDSVENDHALPPKKPAPTNETVLAAAWVSIGLSVVIQLLLYRPLLAQRAHAAAVDAEADVLASDVMAMLVGLSVLGLVGLTMLLASLTMFRNGANVRSLCLSAVTFVAGTLVGSGVPLLANSGRDQGYESMIKYLERARSGESKEP